MQTSYMDKLWTDYMTKIDPIAKFSDNLFLGIVQLIEQAKHKVAVYLIC